MDDLSSHDKDDLAKDTNVDEEGTTPADTNDGEPKTPAEMAKDSQKKAWLEKIKSGEKTVDDMPDNLGWLRKEIEPELGKKVDDDEVGKKVKEALKSEREQEDFALLIEDLEGVDAEKIAQVKDEYESCIEDGMKPLKALITARRLVGLQDSGTIIAERRRKGMLLPPQGNRNRKTVSEDKVTETEKRLNVDLPPGFSPKK